MSVIKEIFIKTTTTLAAVLLFMAVITPAAMAQVTNPQSGAAGLSGTVPAPPPKVGATISFPDDGDVFEEVPIEVTGVCPEELLIKLFKNDVFAGSDICDNGSFSIEIDLFSGENELIALVYDDLNQEGPASNIVIVTYNDDFGTSSEFQRVTVTTNVAKKGVDPGDTLSWPLVISGGIGPYAIKIDWGDGNEDLMTQDVAGEFNIAHAFENPGVYRIVIKITDSRGQSGFLQVVGIVNGPLGQIIDGEGQGVEAAAAGRVVYRWVTWPLILLSVLIIATFWVGRRYEVKKLHDQFAKHQLVFSKNKK